MILFENSHLRQTGVFFVIHGQPFLLHICSMKLITEKGELDLPEDFIITIERNNPFLSGDGDVSIPITLPATQRNLSIIDHMERIDRTSRYFNKMEAILYVGPVRKRGQLVIDTVQRHVGIDVVFAIDNSDLYVKSKDKSLKEIFSSYNNGEGYKKTFGTIADAVAEMEKIYNDGSTDKDYVIFPVAVSPYETGDGENKTTVYQYNNEDDWSGSHHLVYQERAVREGDVSMMVPNGYGISPFLKLQCLLNRLFEILGYSVVYNCFEQSPYFDKFVIVHNCSDCLCNPGVVLYYADMVPSCTLSEFLEWLLAKFMVQPVVNSESHQVRIEKINDLLNQNLNTQGGFDMDISDLLEDDWKVQLNPSKHLVLIPTNELEDTEPAAETFDKLIENYGSYRPCGEINFSSLTGSDPAYYDCLILRQSTGFFYLLERELGTGAMKIRRLGTNHFTYDRKNGDEAEEYIQEDLKPRMFCDAKTKGTLPYIGERIHKHTSYNGGIDDTEQKIIVVQAKTDAEHFCYPTTGTTQDRIFQKNGMFASLWCGLANSHDMYDSFYNNYNRVLKSGAINITGKLKLSLDQFLNLNMATLKLFKNQRLLPVKTTATIRDHIGITEAEFIKKETLNIIDEPEIPIIQSTPLKWNMTSVSDGSTAMMAFRNIFGIQTEDPPAFQYLDSSVSHGDFKDQVWLGMPSELGESKNVSIQLEITLKIRERYIQTDDGWIFKICYYKPTGKYDEEGNQITLDPTTAEFIREKLTPMKTYTFVAVSSS